MWHSLSGQILQRLRGECEEVPGLVFSTVVQSGFESGLWEHYKAKPALPVSHWPPPSGPPASRWTLRHKLT